MECHCGCGKVRLKRVVKGGETSLAVKMDVI